MSPSETEAGGYSTFDESTGPDPLAEPPGWPKFIGITSIIWGSVGLTCSGCGAAWIAAMPRMMSYAEKEFGSPMPDAYKPHPLTLPLSVVGVLMAAILITAGILCVTRNPLTRLAHLVYAPMELLLAAAGTVLGAMGQLRAMEWAAQNQGNKWAEQAGGTLGWIILAFAAFLGTAWPLFCLVWFGALKKRP